MKIFWAIDPFDPETRPDPVAIQSLETWVKSAEAKVVPIYVLSLPPLEAGKRGTDSLQVESARHLVNQYLNEMKVDWAAPPLILAEPSDSIRNAVDQLLLSVKLESGDLIAVSTRGNRGLARAALGSFSETLLSRSEFPVLFLSHRTMGPTVDPRVALFATDFSAASRLAFDAFVRYARPSGTAITLFHHATSPKQAEFALAAPGTLSQLPQSFFEQRESWAQEEARSWAEAAAAQGVPVEIAIKSEFTRTSDLILRTARDLKAGLIAMTSQSNGLTSFLFGSIAREVFRPHELSTWICGPAAGEAAKAKSPARPKTM